MAINLIKTSSIEPGAITAELIPSGAITAEDIGAGTITADKLHTTLDLSDKTLTLPVADYNFHDTTVNNLTVNGTSAFFNVTNFESESQTLRLSKGSTTNLQANGAGLIIEGSFATLTYSSTLDGFQVNKNLSVTSGNLTVDSGGITVNSDFTTNGSGKLNVTNNPSDGNATTQILGGYNETDRAFRLINEHNSGSRYSYLTHNLNYDGTTFTQGAYGPSTAFKFGTSGISVLVNDQVTAGSTDTITPFEVARFNSDSLVLYQATAPSTTTDKLYNDAGDLYWAGTKLNTGTTTGKAIAMSIVFG
jgi:hypothetical protein